MDKNEKIAIRLARRMTAEQDLRSANKDLINARKSISDAIRMLPRAAGLGSQEDIAGLNAEAEKLLDAAADMAMHVEMVITEAGRP